MIHGTTIHGESIHSDTLPSGGFIIWLELGDARYHHRFAPTKRNRNQTIKTILEGK